MIKARTNKKAVTPAVRAAKPRVAASNVVEGDIACRAYFVYLARGGEHGHDVEDWLQSERDLQASASTA